MLAKDDNRKPLAAPRRGGIAPARLLRPVNAGVQLPERIFLVGFMGSGKSSVGAALAARYKWPFVDLDREIEEYEGLSIPTIFLRYGEGYFRRLEFDLLREIVRTPGRSIVALGGGAFVGEVNRVVVARSGVSVWLDVPFRVIVKRVFADQDARPLAQSPDQLYKLYRSRLPFYHEADVRVRPANVPVERVVRAVVRSVREDWSVVAERRRLQL